MTTSCRIFRRNKNNIGNDRDGLAYELRATATLNTQPQVCWSAEPVTLSADEVLTPPPKKPGKDADALNDAIMFLKDALKDGPRPSVEVMEEATEVHGFGRATVQRARKKLSVIANRPHRKAGWMIALPALDATEQALEHQAA